MVLDLHGDSSPCRWAAMFNDDGSDCATQLTDLSPHEQIARGQQLLKLLWEPVTPREVTHSKQVAELPLATTNEFCKPDKRPSELKVHIKNTFVELDKSPCTVRNLTRSQSDSALLNGSMRYAGECDAPISFSMPEAKCQNNSNAIVDADRSGLQSKVVKPQVLTLSNCLGDTWWQESTDRCVELSDASTDTPRESVEDLSINEVFDSSLAGELMQEDDSNFAPLTIAIDCGAYRQEDTYYYPPFDSGCISTQHRDREIYNLNHASMHALDDSMSEAHMYDTFRTSWTESALQGDLVLAGTECMSLGANMFHNEVQDMCEYASLGHGCTPAQQQHPCTVMSLDASCGGSLMQISCPSIGSPTLPTCKWPAPVLSDAVTRHFQRL